MEPFEVYRLYLALKMHFGKRDYDITKTKGAIRANKESYLKRNDLISLRKLARDYKRSEIIDIFVANFSAGDACGGVFSPALIENYKKWLTTKQKMLYNFSTDLDNLILRMELENIKSAIHEEAHPLIFKMYMGKEINLETVVMLDKLRPFVEAYQNDFILDEMCLLVSKYKPFVRFNKDNINSKYREKLNLVYGNEQV